MITSHGSLRRTLAARRGKAPWFARFHYVPVLSYFAVCAFFIFSIDTPLDENHALFFWDLRFVALPLALLVFMVAYRHRIYLRLHLGRRKNMSTFTVAILFYLAALLFGIAFPFAINASGGSPDPVTLQGPITQKYISRGRGLPTYILVVAEQSQHCRMSFSVSKFCYEQAQLGQFYRRTMRIGRLGIPYCWIWQKT